jgi:hypothetical protein
MAVYKREKRVVHFLDDKREPEEHMLSLFEVFTLYALVEVDAKGIQLQELTVRARTFTRALDKTIIQTPIRHLKEKGLIKDEFRRDTQTLKYRHFFSPVVKSVEEVKVTEAEPQAA